MSFPRYPKYKDSGVEWLGEVPEHWEIVSIKWLSPVRRGASPRPIEDPKYFDEGGEYAWVRIADVSACDGVLAETTQRLSELGSSLSVKLSPGELFVSIAGTVGKPCLSGIKACIHDGFVYFPTLTIPPKFLYRIFEAGNCYGGLGKWGTQLNLNTDTIGSIKVALPTANETNQILSFLNRETAKIDALIAEQQRLIELLQEKRQAVISHAVTKGLNPDAPMKDSGIEWLGEVPAHWEVAPFKYLSDISTGFAFKSDDFTSAGIPVLRIGDIRSNGEVDFSEARYLPSELVDEHKDVVVRQSDIVMAMTGATIGKAAFYNRSEPALLNQRVCVFRAINPACQRYIWHLLQSHYYEEYLKVTAFGGAQPNISDAELVGCCIPIPPATEQVQIAEFLDRKAETASNLKANAENAISLLQERRSALISAAVTGQIDVRGLATKEAA
jgi:type I restriction enzyme S subunit